MTDKELMQQALDALDLVTDLTSYDDEVYEAIDALRARLAQPEQESAYGYASRLATAIWEKHYKDESPHWKVNDSLLGVLTQIDNMTTGLVRAQPEQEPVACPYCHYSHTLGAVFFDQNCAGCVNRMTTPPQREWQGLTDEEQNQVAWSCGAMSADWLEFARAIEAKLKEKNL